MNLRLLGLWRWPLALITVAGLCLAGDQSASDKADKESHWPRIRFGGMTLTAGYSYYSGYPGWYGPWGYYPGHFWGYPWGWDPWFYYPWVHPGFYSGFAYGPGMGEIKIQTPDKSAAVYIDGALAGSAGKLKNIWLEPGAYEMSIQSGDREFRKKVYVLSGKTLTLDARNLTGKERP